MWQFSSLLVCYFHFSIEFITRENWRLLTSCYNCYNSAAVKQSPAVRAIIWSFPLSRRCELRTSSSGSPTTGWWTRWDSAWAPHWGPQPPSREETWTTGAANLVSTSNPSTLPWHNSNESYNINIHMMEQQPCVQDIIVRDLATYCTDRLCYVSLMRLSEDLRYYNQSSYIKFPSIFTEKLTYYVNRCLLPLPSPPAWVKLLSFKFTTIVTVTVQLQCICSSYLYIFKHKS